MITSLFMTCSAKHSNANQPSLCSVDSCRCLLGSTHGSLLSAPSRRAHRNRPSGPAQQTTIRTVHLEQSLLLATRYTVSTPARLSVSRLHIRFHRLTSVSSAPHLDSCHLGSPPAREVDTLTCSLIASAALGADAPRSPPAAPRPPRQSRRGAGGRRRARSRSRRARAAAATR